MRLDSPDSPIAVRRGSLPKSGAPGRLPLPDDPLITLCNSIIDRLYGVAKIFATALLVTGARPQELLNITQLDIDTRGFVHIKALKRGQDRVVLCPCLLLLRSAAPILQDQPLFRRFSYAQFYRSITNLYRDQTPGLHHHSPVGRLFRSAFARQNHLTGARDRSLTARTLGHRRTSSTNFYLEQGGDLSG